jgi:hypothetical protein
MTSPVRQSWVTIAVAAGLLLFAVGYLYAATGFAFGQWSSPKAGFFPAIVGVVGTVLAASNLLVVLLRVGPAINLGTSPRRAVQVALGLGAYAFALAWLGFLPATAMVLFYLTKVFGSRGWWLPGAASTAAAALVYLLFQNLLQLSLPGGA